MFILPACEGCDDGGVRMVELVFDCADMGMVPTSTGFAWCFALFLCALSFVAGFVGFAF